MGTGLFHGELATLLWGGAFGFVGLYTVAAQTATRFDPRVRRPRGSLENGADQTLVFTVDALPATPPFFGWWLRLEGRHSPQRSVRVRVRLDALQTIVTLGWPRGSYTVQGRWELADAFGLSRLVPRALWTATVTILPEPAAFTPPRPPASRPGPWTPRRTGRRAGEPFDVRRYVAGDDLRRLHWPLYAHAGDLFVRTPEPTPPPTGHQFIVLDTEAASEEDLDGRLGGLVTWLTLLGTQGTDWTLAIPAADASWGPGDPWMAQLAALSPAEFPDHPVPPGWPPSVVLVTGPDSRSATRLASRLAAARRRFQPVVIPLNRLPAPKAAWWRRP